MSKTNTLGIFLTLVMFATVQANADQSTKFICAEERGQTFPLRKGKLRQAR